MLKCWLKHHLCFSISSYIASTVNQVEMCVCFLLIQVEHLAVWVYHKCLAQKTFSIDPVQRSETAIYLWLTEHWRRLFVILFHSSLSKTNPLLLLSKYQGVWMRSRSFNSGRKESMRSLYNEFLLRGLLWEKVWNEQPNCKPISTSLNKSL